MAPPEPVNLATDILSKKTKKDKIHSHNDSQPISLGDRQKKKKRDDKSKAVLPPEDETLVNVEKRKRDDGEAAKVATSSRRKTLKANCNKNSLLPEPTTASLDVKDRPDVKEGMPRKRKREEGIVQAENSDRKKDKKRRLECNEENGPVTATTTFDKPHKSKKNKRKNKTGFPDPDDDNSLSEQSKKCSCLHLPLYVLTDSILQALVYAFSQFRRPGKWKFNKARQNWLIRNIWSSEMVKIILLNMLHLFIAAQIPEIYFALVVTYLAKVQGRVRDVRSPHFLLHKCQVRLSLEPHPGLPCKFATSNNRWRRDNPPQDGC